MLKRIKSFLILKKIFMNLHDDRLLKFIKYNNFLQQKLDINLNNYKLFTGKYIEYDTNGNGKEYDSNHNLLFEGGYLNGKDMEKEKNIIVMEI